MKRRSALLALALVLASCSSSPKDPRACPRLGVIADAAELVRYRAGDGRDLTDQLFSARLGDVVGSCRLDKASANVEMRVAIVADRGPAMTRPDEAEVEYFVAVTGPGDEILAKETFRTRLDFANRNRTGVAEELSQRIPLPAGSDPGAYSILVGFQLTPEELSDNRRRRR